MFEKFGGEKIDYCLWLRHNAKPYSLNFWQLNVMNGKELPDTSFTKFTAHQFKRELQANHPQILELECFIFDKNDRVYQFWQRDPLRIIIGLLPNFMILGLMILVF